MTSQPILRKQRTCEDMNTIHIPVTGICNVCVVFGEKGSMLPPDLTAADVPPPKIPRTSKPSSHVCIFLITEKYCKRGQPETHEIQVYYG